MTELPFSYYVSYAHRRGFGSIHISSDVMFTLYDQLDVVRSEIARLGDGLTVDEIVVLNFILLSGPPTVDADSTLD